jgi:hypothetical protein
MKEEMVDELLLLGRLLVAAGIKVLVDELVEFDAIEKSFISNPAPELLI